MDSREKIERSIITTYRKSIWRSFTRALSEYRLIQAGDHKGASRLAEQLLPFGRIS